MREYVNFEHAALYAALSSLFALMLFVLAAASYNFGASATSEVASIIAYLAAGFLGLNAFAILMSGVSAAVFGGR